MKETFDYDNISWKIVNSYFSVNKGYQLVKHQIDTFDYFIIMQLKQIMEGFNPIEINHSYMPELEKFKYNLIINITNPILGKPIITEKDGSTKVMTPNDARKRNFTYASNLTVDINIKTKSLIDDTSDYLEETKEIKGVPLGKIPIMVKSNYCVLKSIHEKNNNECIYDFGGYFIINGNEKVIIPQDRISENIPFVFLNNKVSTYSHIAEIRSVQENKLGVPKITTLRLSAKPNQFGRYIRANIHHIKTDIPLFILFKALGVCNDKEIIEYIVYDLSVDLNINLMNELVACIEESNTIVCQKDALEYLSKYLNITGYPKEILFNKIHRINIVKNVLEKEFLPHVGREFTKKALYLGYMVNKLLKCYLGLRNFDDRDSYINKRVDTPGVLMANLFRQYYGKVIKDMKNMLQKEINTGGWKATNKFNNIINKINVTKLFKSTIIDSGLRYALATGNWGIKNNKNKQGVAQVLNRMTYNSTLSHLRRINTPIEKSGKLVQPRKLHNTQWGIICPCECFDPNTPILMWSGIIKKAEDIVVGDYLIDDKGNAVRVKSTCSGIKEMYEVIPDKKNFMNYTVTDNHILTLKVKKHNSVRTHRGKKELTWFDKKELKYRYKDFSNTADLELFMSSIDDDDVIDITIEKYLSLPKAVQKELYTFKSDGINWETKEVVLDPYILGMWLGDGLSCGYGFVTADFELRDKWIEWGKDNDATIKKGLKYKYGISSTINNTQSGISCNKTEKAPLKKLLAKYKLVNNKHIPIEYLTNDRKTRLAVLAGLIDTDGSIRANGHEIRIPQGEPNYQIIYDAEFLARSLGFSCHVNNGICSYTVNGEKRQKPYKELTITGQYLYEIPTVLPRKKLNKFENPTSIKRCSSFLQSSFELIKKDIQPFVGWQLEGNGRFLLSDMSTVHNTPEGASVGLVKNMSMMTNISISSNSINVKELIKDIGLIEWDEMNSSKYYSLTKVIVNGDIFGFYDKPDEMLKILKNYKRRGTINVQTSIVWNLYDNEIIVCTEGGRCIRPLIIVDDHNTRLTEDYVSKEHLDWNELVFGGPNKVNDEENSVIEFLDVGEMNASMIAMKYDDIKKGVKGSLLPVKYTHLEINPTVILGVAAANIPFPDHNQAPRNCYQCIWEEELVLMANGDRKMIRDVKVGDEVITFDPITMSNSITRVINHFVKSTEKKIYKIKTVSGKSITATYDHLFMTNVGWKKVEDLVSTDIKLKVGIFVGNSEPLSTEVDDYIIIDKEIIKEKMEKYGFNTSYINNVCSQLTNQGLLPLTSKNAKLALIAKISGFILTDGAINIYKDRSSIRAVFQADFGCNLSAETFENDMEFLGFNKTKISQSYAEGYGHTYKVYHSGALPAFLICLGISFGKKVDTERKPVPDWIMNGSLHVQREFIAGFQGGDGCQIRWNKFKKCGYNCVCAETSQQIIPIHTKSLNHFFEQLKVIMTRIGIKTNDVTICKIDDNRNKIALKIKDTHENLIDYFTKIGYRYDTRKSINSAKVVEYLRFKDLNFQKYKLNIEILRKMYDDGKSTREIANETKINIDRVRDHIRSYKDGREISTPNLGDNNYIDIWINQIEEKGCTIFVPVDSIEEVPNCMIADITVASDNHSFIAGDSFQVHNSSMSKQAIGIYASNFRDRLDTLGHILNYGQKPLVRTKMNKILKLDNLPNGINTIVAIMTYTGYNQEDSVILNQSSVDRGLFTSTYYRTYKEQNNKNHSNGEEEFFTKPETSAGNKSYVYDKLGEDGFVPENTFVKSGDIIIGKCMPNKNNGVMTYKDNSVPLTANEKGFVDQNCYNDNYFKTVNGDGYSFCKVRIRSDRVPTIGDKLAARSAQKGTIGITYKQEDMPFTREGIVPDIIMNPNAIPSRMTIGQLMESLMGKACSLMGTYGDSTPFTGCQVEDIASLLEKSGMERYGNEVMYDPRTGQQMNCDIFIGPTFYQRLKHMTTDKIHCYDKETDILTDKGWINFKDLTKEYKVATIVDEALVYQNPIEIQSKEFSGKMYKVKSNQVDLLVTDNHRMYISNRADPKYRLELASYVYHKRYYYKKDVNKWNPDIQNCPDELVVSDDEIVGFLFPNSEKVVNIDSWLTFFGIWMAEGCSTTGNRTCFAADKPKVREMLGPICDEFEIKYTESKYYREDLSKPGEELEDREGINWYIYDKDLWNYLRPLSVGAINKSLPDWVWYLNRDQCKTLIQGMMYGDGDKPNKHGTKRYYTSSTKLADDFQRLCLHAGYSTNKTKRTGMEAGTSRVMKKTGKIITHNADAYHLNIIESQNEPLVNKNYNMTRDEGALDSWEDYDGMVYCCTVPLGEGVIYVRRNGVSVWSGNSRASNGPIVSLTRQPAEGRARRGGLRLGEMEVEVMLAEGLIQFLKERLMECSDNYRIHVCKQCGYMCIANPEKKIYNCRNCKNITNFAEIRIPYAAKLLFHEIQTMGLGAKFIT
jgi:DNA-directed RNA polymerase beta subunit